MKRKREQKYVAIVTAKCIGCGAKQDIQANEIPPNEQPICTACGMPMIAVSARAQ
jgi:hypothetical protein